VDPLTGKLIGMPKEWTDNYDIPLDYDAKKTIKTKHLPEAVRASELPDALID